MDKRTEMLSTREPLSEQVWGFFVQNPWASLLQILFTICILTRTLTQFGSSLRSADPKSGTKSIPRLSYWIPFVGSSATFSFRAQDWLLETSRSLESNVFGLRLYGRDYIVVTTPALQELLTSKSSPVTTKDYDNLRSSRFFNNRRVSSATSDRISKSLQMYLADSRRISKFTRLLEVHSYNFISPSKSWVDQAQWERGSDINILKEKPVLTVSASLAKLVRDFSANMILSTLLSTSFVEANANFVEDFFSFSSSYSTFMTGLPYYIAPGLGPPALAREKCLLALDSLVDATTAELDGNSMSGKGTGMLYDLDDLHPAIWNIVKQARTESTVKLDRRVLASEILEVIWNTTFASVNMTLWALVYLFGQDGENKSVLEEIKLEIKKAVEVVKPKPTGLPFEDPPRLKFVTSKEPTDIEKQCPTLYNSLLEILRLETEQEQYLVTQDDFVLSADAAPDPNSTKKPALLSNVVEKFQLRKGDKIYVPFGANNRDAYYWDRPRRFAPNRYKLAGGTHPRLSRTRWGFETTSLSESMCILIALLSFYEFENIKHPGRRIVAGAGVPKGTLRATISRRKL